MGYNIKPFRGIQLNHSHPLSRRLVGCWILNEGSGPKLWDLSRGNHGTIPSGVDWIAGENGFGLNFAGGSSNEIIRIINGEINNHSWAKGLTIVWFGNVGPLTMNFPMWVTQDDNGAASAPFNLRCNSTTDQVHFVGDDGGGTQIDFISSSAATQLTANTDTQIVVSQKAGSGKIYVNGVLKNTGSRSETIQTGEEINFMGREQGTGFEVDGKMYYCYIYDRVLSDEEVSWLYREPYAMFETQSPGRFIFVPIGGVTHELAGSLNSASQLTGLLNLTQRLSGSLDSTSHASGVLRLIQRLSGSLNSSSVISGTLRLIHGLSGTVQSASQLAGNLRLIQRLKGALNSISALIGNLRLIQRITGSLNSTSHLSGDLRIPGTHNLSGSLNSTSHLSGTLTEDRIQEIILASGTRTLQLEASGIRTTQLTASGYRTLQLTASGTKE